MPAGEETPQGAPGITGSVALPKVTHTTATPAGVTTTSSSEPVGPFALPPDATVYSIAGQLWSVFTINGVSIAYSIKPGAATFNQAQVQTITPEQGYALNAVNAGDAEELRDLGLAFPSYTEFFNSILVQVMGQTNPAKDNPEVLRVIAEFAGRPDMTAAELTNRLQATQWYQTHTQGEMEYNSLGDAEKQKRREQVAAQMVSTWFQFAGEAIGTDDPRIQDHLEEIASGKLGLGAWTEQVVKPAALTNETSPYARQLTQEQQAQKQPGVDLENTAQKIKKLAHDWGIQWSESTYQDYARRVIANETSDADVLADLQQQAQVLYAWKTPEMVTNQAAAPWIETYKRIMEKDADLFQPQVQAALTAGQPVWEFEKSLKQSADWRETKNARGEMVSIISEAGRKLGFT